MTEPQVKIVNAQTGETIVRATTAEELAQMEIDAASSLAQKTAEAAKAAQKQAVLDRLGITAEEASLLLGGN